MQEGCRPFRSAGDQENTAAARRRRPHWQAPCRCAARARARAHTWCHSAHIPKRVVLGPGGDALVAAGGACAARKPGVVAANRRVGGVGWGARGAPPAAHAQLPAALAEPLAAVPGGSAAPPARPMPWRAPRAAWARTCHVGAMAVCVCAGLPVCGVPCHLPALNLCRSQRGAWRPDTSDRRLRPRHRLWRTQCIAAAPHRQACRARAGRRRVPVQTQSEAGEARVALAGSPPPCRGPQARTRRITGAPPACVLALLVGTLNPNPPPPRPSPAPRAHTKAVL